MLLKDDTLEIIARNLKLTTLETEAFIADIRNVQSEIFWTSFFVFYEINKSALEHKYLQMVINDLANAEHNFQKIIDILSSEFDNNPEVIEFIAKRMDSFSAQIIRIYCEDKDEKITSEIIESIFMGIDGLKRLQPSANSSTLLIEADEKNPTTSQNY